MFIQNPIELKKKDSEVLTKYFEKSFTQVCL